MSPKHTLISRAKQFIGIASFIIFTSLTSQAQNNLNKPFSSSKDYKTWSVGVHSGILSQANVFDIGVEFDNLEYNLGYGAFVRKHIFPNFAVQAEYLGGKVSGKDSENFFNTKLTWSGSVNAHFTLGNINWRQKSALIKPYLNVGFGYMSYKPYTVLNDTAYNYTDTEGMFIPAGLGVKVKLTNDLNLDLGYRMNFTRSDGFDGAKTKTRDAFSYSHIGLEFAIGSKAKPFLGNTNPVAEIVHQQDLKYDELMKVMETQLQAQEESFAKREKQLIEENNKVKSQIERLYADFADDDADGVPNRYDKCPDTPKGVQVDGSGCPLPEAKAPIIQQIYVTEEDKKVVDEAIKNLEFDLGKATIRSSSFESLNKVAVLLIEKNFSLKLAGHTDNTGAAELNMRLSKNRAEAIKTYLVSKGANASRIEAVGYGHTQPIVSNNTEEGRQKNRRVEFTLY